MSLIGNKRVSSHYLCPKSLLVHFLCAFSSPMHFRLSIVFAGLVTLAVAGNLVRVKRQSGTGLTFAIPGLNLLGGGLGLGNNNIFGQQTFTRTVISTVSTVTTASFRTCTTSAAALMPCAGRRRRDVGGENDVEVDATPAISLIIGSTTISNPVAVSQYLEAHQPSSQSIIYPADYVAPSEISQDSTTLLYPSDDTPTHDHINEDTISDIVTTELPLNDDSNNSDAEEEISTTPNPADSDTLESDKDRARLLGTTTTTTVIRVTSVATTIATGAMATLTVSYAGCLPPSLPITTNVCA